MSIRLIPRGYASKDDSFQTSDMTSKTYFINFERGKAQGKMDAIDAMKQAIYKCLQTHWLAHVIYDEQYGFEAAGLIGKDRGYIESEMKRRIRDALMQDTRIRSVRRFAFYAGEQPDSLAVSFCVETRFGTLDERMEVGLL